MKTILILVLAVTLSGCVANRFIANKKEFKEKVLSKKNIPLNSNYEKIAKCWDDAWDHAGNSNLHIFGDLGLVEWSMLGEFGYYFVLITFNKKSENETLADIYTIFPPDSINSFLMAASIQDIEPVLIKCAG